ncbi:hypothetical protein Cci01nite_16960 [Catellatospora citrea]|uniref:Uncharacterized protein n=1 Tax=Catellatospora citrea TaxID=53366 RepID=A0A8J3K544_9ACTN|nr:hypothetical protein Cci01nite_16960 [Catellatospora citrea]
MPSWTAADTAVHQTASPYPKARSGAKRGAQQHSYSSEPTEGGGPHHRLVIAGERRELRHPPSIRVDRLCTRFDCLGAPVGPGLRASISSASTAAGPPTELRACLGLQMPDHEDLDVTELFDKRQPAAIGVHEVEVVQR